jgi:hypothetical protein
MSPRKAKVQGKQVYSETPRRFLNRDLPVDDPVMEVYPAVAIARLSLKPLSGTGMRGRFSGKVGSHAGLLLEGALRLWRQFGVNGSRGPRSGDRAREDAGEIVEPLANEPLLEGSPTVHPTSNTAAAMAAVRDRRLTTVSRRRCGRSTRVRCR